MKNMKAGAKSCSLDDARARFKHLRLLQDFQELQKVAEVARNRLQIVNDKKLTLEAEVRFLRRRYDFLLKVRAESHQKKQRTIVPEKLSLLSRKTTRETNIDMKCIAARPPVPKFDSSRKVKIHKQKDTTPSMQKLSLSIDLNQNIKKFKVPESTLKNRVHQLDLNQIANDDDDFQSSAEPKTTEAKASAFVKGFADEPISDMKLSVCRNISNPASRGKRKISWQDQIVLRV